MALVKTCKRCGKIFETIVDAYFCSNCRSELDVIFKRVRKYIRENKDANINVVSEACNVSINQLLMWVREERLAFTSDSDVGISCLGCGASIGTGKYCNACKTKLSKDLKSVYNNQTSGKESLVINSKNKMHTRDDF